jgi:FkbM family methyltransferase
MAVDSKTKTRFGSGFDFQRRIAKAFKCPLTGQRLAESTQLGLTEIAFGTIIDIGANEGQLALTYAKLFPLAQIHCFEPTPEIFMTLRENTAQFGGKITAHNFAVGDQKGTLTFNLLPNLHAASSLLSATKLTNDLYPKTGTIRKIDVQVVRLDDYLKEARIALSENTLIKVDVQGYEARVIQGGKRSFGHAKACIIEVMVDTLYSEQSKFSDIFLALHKLDFEFVGTLEQAYGTNGHVIYFDAVFVKRNGQQGNPVAH